MKYCTKCGKQLEDDEVCGCEATKLNEVKINTEDTSKPIITKEQATEISKGLVAYAKDFFANPMTACENAENNSFVTVAGLAVANMALAIIVDLLTYLLRSIKGYYKPSLGNYISAVTMNVVWWICIPLAFAGLIWVAAKYIEKEEVEFGKALSIFSIPAIPLLAFGVIDLLRLVLSHTFFSVIFSTLHAGIGAVMIYLTGVSIQKLIGKSDKNMVSYALIAAGLYFVNWVVCYGIF